MRKFLLWAYTGENGQRVIRHAGPFTPEERIVSVCVPDGDQATAVLQVIEAEYAKHGVSLEYDLKAEVDIER